MLLPALALSLLLQQQRPPEERYDHHGAVGLLVAGTGVRKETNALRESYWGGSLDVGGTLSIGWESSEVILVGRLTFGGPRLDSQIYGGYRGYFGLERWKTLIDLNAALHFTPHITAGPRVAIGVQYELAPIAGVYAQLGAQLGFGQVLLFKAELLLGVQLRSFLLE